MSIRLMAKVWDAQMDTTLKFILLSLADYADDNGQNVYPSIATIQRKTGYGERTVQRAFRELEEAGILVRVGQTSFGTYNYRISVGSLEDYKGGATVTPGGATQTPPFEETPPGGATVTPGGAIDDKKDGEGVPHRHPGGATVTPDPSVKPSVNINHQLTGAPENFLLHPPNLGCWKNSFQELWEYLRDQLRLDMERTLFTMYVSGTEAIGLQTCDDGQHCLLVQCPTLASKSWCASHLDRQCDRNIRILTGGALTRVIYQYEE